MFVHLKGLKALQVSKRLFITLILTKERKKISAFCLLVVFQKFFRRFPLHIKVRYLHHNRFWLAGSEIVVSLAGSFTISQTAVDSPYFGELEALPKPQFSAKTWSIFFSLFKMPCFVGPSCSPSCGGDVAVYVLDINQPSLPTPFSCTCLCLFLSVWPFQLYFNHKFSQQLFAFSLCSLGLISTLLVLSARYFFTKGSFSPDIVLCGWLGLKLQLTN